MASDSDACLPQTLTDFIFDLYECVTMSQVAEDQSKLYSNTFRELSSKYYTSSPWPSPQTIASECNGHPLFLALYRELTHRHWHAVSRPTIRDRIEGWHVYRELFDEILLDAEDGGSTGSTANFYILPLWAFDVLHEFVYQFQGFCQFRATLHASATKYGVMVNHDAAVNAAGGGAAGGGSGTTATTTTTTTTTTSGGGKSPPHHVVENVTILSQNTDAWAAETVLYYLHRLIDIGTSPKCSIPAYQYLGLFSSVVLSRLECLLGDYHASLAALAPITNTFISVTKEDETKSVLEVVNSVYPARLSMAYHGGIAFLMLRRYKDASRLLGNICANMHRGFKTGQLRKLPNSDQYAKSYDRMLGLLAIVTHICPPTGLVEDVVVRTVREKYGPQLSKIDAGEDGYESLFINCCPKFVSPALPDFTQPYTDAHDAFKFQVKLFMKEMTSQNAYRKLRSYLKLYTSIEVSKLAKFNDSVEDQFIPLLLSYKNKMRQLENPNLEETPALDGDIGSALDIHYYVVENVVHVDEAEKQRRFENYFMAQINQNVEIMKDVEGIDTTV